MIQIRYDNSKVSVTVFASIHKKDVEMVTTLHRHKHNDNPHFVSLALNRFFRNDNSTKITGCEFLNIHLSIEQAETLRDYLNSELPAEHTDSD